MLALYTKTKMNARACMLIQLSYQIFLDDPWRATFFRIPSMRGKIASRSIGRVIGNRELHDQTYRGLDGSRNRDSSFALQNRNALLDQYPKELFHI